MADTNITIGVKLSENFNRMNQQVAEFETRRLQASMAQMQADAARQAQLQKTQKLEMAMDVLRREADKRQAAAAAEKLRVEQQYHMAMDVLRREADKRQAARAESEAISARDSRNIYQRMLHDRMQLEARTAQTQAQIARTTADTQIQHIKRVEQEEMASAQRLYRAGIGRSRTLMDSNMGGRRGAGWDFLGGQSFRTVGFQLRAIPGGGLPETIGRLTPLLDVMTELATGTSTAGAGALALTGGLVALGLVIGESVRQIQALTEMYKRNIEAQREFMRKSRDMTTEQIRERVAELQRDIAQRSTDFVGLEQQVEDARQRAIGANLGTGVLTNLFGGNAAQRTAEFEALLVQRNEESQKLLELNQEMLSLNTALLNGSNAAADAEEAERELAEARLQTFREQADLAINIQKMTQAERNARMREIDNEIDTLQRLAEEHQGNSIIQDEVAERTQRLNSELSDLKQVIWTIADAAAAATLREDLLSDQTDMLFDTQTKLGEALEAVREATEAYDEALADHEEKMLEIDADAQEKREEAYADAADDFAKAEMDAQKKREDQEKEHRDRIAEINRKADRDIANAIGNRDALAAYLAEQQRQDDLADEAARHKDQLEQIEEAYDDQKKAIQKRLDDQLEAIEKAAAKARQAEQKRYADQARDLQAAIDKQKAMVWNAENQLTAIRTGFQNTRIIKENDYQMKLYNITVAGQEAVLFRTQYFWNAMEAMVPKVAGAIGKTGGGMTRATVTAAINRQVDLRLNQTFTRASA